jgi:hypothetical protein
MKDSIPEGASRTFRVRVPDGRGGFKSLVGYSFAGALKTAPPALALVATLGGALDPEDETAGLIDLLPSDTAGKPGTYRLELEATNGSQVHVRLDTLHVEDR